MLATIQSAVLVGTDGQPVTVEVHESGGIPSFNIVGLPDASCREARDQVRAALLSSGFGWPQQRVTVNLAPSGVRKVGASLDLAVAVGVLVVTGALPASSMDGIACIGELGLDGSVRSVPGTLSLVDALTTPVAVVAAESAAEARLVGRHDVRAVGTLAELVRAVLGEEPWPPAPPTPAPEPPRPVPDLRDVRGQPTARLAPEVAAVGLHHLLLVGPPGVGKTMLAARLPGLLPRLERSAALEVTRIHSAAGRPLPPGGLIRQPPFRSPHHTATAPALIGGGSGHLRPGEISLAHNGVLFLDELAEFPAHVLDALRQPLEEGTVRVSRSRASASFRARFLLVAAMNPCPCGQGGPPGSCRCSEAARARHARRISGPLLTASTCGSGSTAPTSPTCLTSARLVRRRPSSPIESLVPVPALRRVGSLATRKLRRSGSSGRSRCRARPARCSRPHCARVGFQRAASPAPEGSLRPSPISPAARMSPPRASRSH